MRHIDTRPGHAIDEGIYWHGEVNGHAIDRIEVRDIGHACRGVIVGHAILTTANGGLVHAVVIDCGPGPGRSRAVYLDRVGGFFVSVELP